MNKKRLNENNIVNNLKSIIINFGYMIQNWNETSFIQIFPISII